MRPAALLTLLLLIVLEGAGRSLAAPAQSLAEALEEIYDDVRDDKDVRWDALLAGTPPDPKDAARLLSLASSNVQTLVKGC